MEHQTMTTIGGFGFGLVAHELGHMWYGDNVTCAKWNDIWINEGFATYTDYCANESILGFSAAQQWLSGRHQQVKGQPGGSVYVPDEELGNIWRIFDGRLSYSKGGLLLHMIRWELGDDDLFFEIMQEFTDQYTDSTATGDDFETLVQSISGVDFDWFFDQWYYGEGYPIFDITWSQDDNNFYMQSTQTTSTNVTTLFKVTIPVHVKFQDDSDTTFRFYQDANFDQFSAAITQPVAEVTIDPDQWILHQLNSLLVVLDEVQSPVKFTFGPNPANDMLNIFLVNQENLNYTLKISDLAGRLVRYEQLSGEQNQLDIRNLAKGAYNIELSDGENTLTKKLIKE
jgi:aminopeptidase N